MAAQDYELLSYHSPDGAQLGGTSTDKIGFWGVTPVTLGTSIATATASATLNALQFADFNMLSSIGGILFGLSQLLFLWMIIHTLRKGEPVGPRPWEGARGLEWTLPSPLPHHTFTTPPTDETVRAEGPYGHG